MLIGIYDPYLDTLGGGEKYILSIASHLADKNKVNLFWDDPKILTTASKKLNLNLKNVQVVNNIFASNTSFVGKMLTTQKYDIIFFLSDGSIPLLWSKRNILILHFPVNWVKGKSILNRIKLQKIERIICYTNFVKKYLDLTFEKKVSVLYPPVDEINSTKNQKENIILSVGRFTRGINEKKQADLISTFKKMCEHGLKRWKLVLIGSYLPGDIDFVKSLIEDAKRYPIEIIPNASFDKLAEYYKKAKIYWHAAGFGEDLDKHPEKAEHFGISTVEAMSAGGVPVVINAGGQKEIVTDFETGYLWDDLGQLKKQTEMLITDSSLLEKISRKAKERAKDFSKEIFFRELDSMLNEND